jgi:hypothetical protein
VIEYLDTLLGAPRWRSAHTLAIRATPARADAALREVRMQDLPLTGGLMALRSLPAILTGARGGRRRGAGDRPLLQRMGAIGLVVRVDEPGRGIVLGLIGQPWRLRGGEQGSAEDAGAFALFDRPGLVRALTGLWAEADAGPPTRAGIRTTLRTETRIAPTDAGTGRRFAAYWRVVGPFSGVTRSEMLRAVRRRAEG